MTTHDHSSRLRGFLSLRWYETLLLFIANFVAKSSELLLTAGLIVSSANFLTDGSMLHKGTPFAVAWAWTQAIAIDGSLGVSFYEVFWSLKRRDWIKSILYTILTVLLTLVAWFITEGDIFSHAVNTSSHDAMQLMNIDVRLLSTLRAVAVVGFVLMGRLRDITLWESTQHVESQIQIIDQPSEQNRSIQSEKELEAIIQNLIQQHVYSMSTTPEESEGNKYTSPLLAQQALTAQAERQNANNLVPTFPQAQQENVERDTKDNRDSQTTQNILVEFQDGKFTQDERISLAYQELQQEGLPVSGRSLAQRAHIRRSTCLEWLRAHENS